MDEINASSKKITDITDIIGEITIAAESLRDQAVKLAEVVSAFRLNKASAAPSHGRH